MFSDPQFWVLVAFIIFVGVTFHPIRKILLKNLDIKISEIKDRIDKAEKLKNDTQLALSEIIKRQNEVKKEIDVVNLQAKKKITNLSENTLLKLNEQINKRKNLSSIKIEQMIRDANIEVQRYIAQIAINTTFNILENKLKDKEKQNLINQSINELKSVLKN